MFAYLSYNVTTIFWMVVYLAPLAIPALVWGGLKLHRSHRQHQAVKPGRMDHDGYEVVDGEWVA